MIGIGLYLCLFQIVAIAINCPVLQIILDSMKNSLFDYIFWTYDPYKVKWLRRKRWKMQIFCSCNVNAEHSSEAVGTPALCLGYFDLNLNWKTRCDRFFMIFFSISRQVAG
jgi:hypothetical protein